ncbi:MAG: hypothetical protein WCF94_03575 [bacterium]
MEEKKTVQEGLLIKEVLTQVYEGLKKKFGVKEIKLTEKAMAEIADDSDWHRTRMGYTGYNSCIFLKIGNKEFCVALGEKCGAYPADPYNCDIAVVSVSRNGVNMEALDTKVSKALGENSYFRSSVIIAMADGSVGAVDGGLGAELFKIVGPKAKEVLFKKIETNPDLLSPATLTPMVTSAARYKPEFVDILIEGIETVLQKA